MALSDTTLREFIRGGQIRIEPFEESNLTPAGYDLRSSQDITLNRGEQMLLATLERIELSPDVLGILHLKSSYAREGLYASLALVDPGFRGQLTVSLLNSGENLLSIERGESFLQLTVLQLSTRSERPYDGKYQESSGIVESKRRLQATNSSKVA